MRRYRKTFKPRKRARIRSYSPAIRNLSNRLRRRR